MFKENVRLKEYTTMKTGGNARYFFVVKNIKELKKAIFFTKEKNLSFFILGGGSNTIISDEGFNGVVIKMEILGIVFDKEKDDIVKVIAGAGVEWDSFVGDVVCKNLYGLENLSLIPGTVGASPVQNIGAYGVEVKDVIEYVEVLNSDTMEIKKIMNKECLFDYRDSFFKSELGRKFIILKVAFNLKKKSELKIDYKDIKEYFSENKPTLNTLRDAIIEIRKDKMPDMRKIGTAGSFFKNPIVTENMANMLKKEYPSMPRYSYGNGFVKLSTAWLLDKVGKWKGVCRGDACVYEHQALVLVNRGRANTKQILSLANEMKEDIKQKTGVELGLEVNILK